MNSQALFLGGCIPARLLLAFAAYKSGTNSVLQILFACVLATMAVGFLTIYIMGWRKTGAETFGKPIWWNSLRPVHGSLYALAAVAVAFGAPSTAATLILVDTAIGTAAFAIHHTSGS